MSQRIMGENRTSSEEPTEGPPSPDSDRAPVAAVEAYERELRERLSSGPPGPELPSRRWGGAILVALVLVSAGIYFAQRKGQREEDRKAEAARYVEAARNGIARDTRGAYAASVEALRAALALDPEREEAKAMLALALARLAIDYGSGDADREEALRRAAEAGDEHAAVLEARYLLTREEDARAEVEEAIVKRAEEDSSAAIQSLAGEILLRRGASAQAIDRFNAAMRAMPGHVPTLVRIGDYYRSRREHAEALRYYDLALAVAEDHVDALLGAAESHLALRSEPKLVQGALADLSRIRDEAMVPVASRARRIWVEAELHLALGDRAAARMRLEALAPTPPPADLAVPIVQSFVRAGAAESAARRFEEFTADADSDPRLREAWVRVLLARHEFARATEVPAAPGERELRVLKGIAWFELGDLRRARELIRSARREGKLPAEAIVHLAWIDWREGARKRALPTLERYGTGERARTSGALAYAEALWDRGEPEHAHRILSRAMERDPHAANLWYTSGTFAWRRGDLEAAARAMSDALERNPDHARARAALATLRLEMGDPEGAREAWERLSRQWPESVEARAGLAWVEWRRGNREKAEQMAESALQAAGDDPFPRLVRARIHLEKGSLAAAERLLAQAAGLRPTDGRIWWELGNLRLELGDVKGASTAFGRAGSAWRKWSFARIGMARALTAGGRAVTATRDLQAFLESADHTPVERAWAHAALGEALLAQGKGFATSARAEARHALGLVADLPLAAVVFAEASDALGDSATAAAQHERIGELAPHLPSAVLARARHLRDSEASVEEAVEVYRRYLDLAPRGPGAQEARRYVARTN